jgi:hypothetical protein
VCFERLQVGMAKNGVPETALRARGCDVTRYGLVSCQEVHLYPIVLLRTSLINLWSAGIYVGR